MRLDPDTPAAICAIRITTTDSAVLGGLRRRVAPDGTVVDVVDGDPPLVLAPLRPSFVLERASDEAAWTVGRAGMRYRDLLPDRQGGRFVASHIHIPDAGPVPDYVHFHNIRFQMIYCYRGWVRLVYEDQGDPFVMSAGDCVLQPPRIRHRVLESSAGLEVIEVGCPALHETFADPDTELPTGRVDPNRDFGGQRYAFHQAAEAAWAPDSDGFGRRRFGFTEATNGLAEASVLRPVVGVTPTGTRSHGGELLFTFVLDGAVTLRRPGAADERLGVGDCFNVPAGDRFTLIDRSTDLELLEVSLPN